MSRTKEELDKVLARILEFYEGHRAIGYSKEKAKEVTIDCYDDLIDWINKEGDFKERHVIKPIVINKSKTREKVNTLIRKDVKLLWKKKVKKNDSAKKS